MCLEREPTRPEIGPEAAAGTFRDFLRKRLLRAFTRANQFRRIAQHSKYMRKLRLRQRERLYDIPWYLTDVNLLCSTKREGEAIRYPMVPHRCQFIVQYQERGSFACAKLALNVASLVQSVCKMFLHFRKACAKCFFTCAKLVLSVHNGNKLKSLFKKIKKIKKKKKIKQNDC